MSKDYGTNWRYSKDTDAKGNPCWRIDSAELSLVAFTLCALSTFNVHAECETQQTGLYAGAGYAGELRQAAQSEGYGHLYAGFQFCNGIKVEYLHSSRRGNDDSIELKNGQDELATSENSLGVSYTVWFSK